MRADADKPTAWTPIKIQLLCRHLNQRYYVRTFAGGKKKWDSLQITWLSVPKNRVKEPLDAAERQKRDGACGGQADLWKGHGDLSIFRKAKVEKNGKVEAQESRQCAGAGAVQRVGGGMGGRGLSAARWRFWACDPTPSVAESARRGSAEPVPPKPRRPRKLTARRYWAGQPICPRDLAFPPTCGRAGGRRGATPGHPLHRQLSGGVAASARTAD